MKAHDVHESNSNKESVWGLGIFILQCLYLSLFYEISFLEIRAIFKR